MTKKNVSAGAPTTTVYDAVAGGGDVPYVKIMDGAEGSGAPVSFGNVPALSPNGTEAAQTLTVDATVGGVQFAAFHADTKQVFWTCETAQCRVTFDDTAPTASAGHVINPGDSGVWSKALAVAAKFIRTGGTSASILASQMV